MAAGMTTKPTVIMRPLPEARSSGTWRAPHLAGRPPTVQGRTLGWVLAAEALAGVAKRPRVATERQAMALPPCAAGTRAALRSLAMGDQPAPSLRLPRPAQAAAHWRPAPSPKLSAPADSG